MFESIFTLRQETPIIHFLHDQPGATLRATELKPKLDKLLLSKLRKTALKDWEIKTDNKEHLSLDYKVSVRPTGKSHLVQLDSLEKIDRITREVKWETATYPHLLANMGGKEYREELKNLVLYDSAEISIKTWHESLLEKINIYLPQLLANTNFGNRSGKGFGSFTCTAVDGTPQKTKPQLAYCFDWQAKGVNVAEQQKHLFSAINWFYKCLRSGINQVNRNGETEFYFKSLMFAYAQDKGDRWDKYTIKNYFFTGGELPENKADYRDWLGLSTEEMWGRKYNNQKITKSGEIPKQNEKVPPEEVGRFASPLIFKPMRLQGNQFKVYFGLTDFPKAEFAKAKIKVETGNKPPLYLTPSAKFDFSEFFRFAFEERDIEEHITQFDRDNINDTRYWLYRDFIQPIFASIRQNLRQNV